MILNFTIKYLFIDYDLIYMITYVKYCNASFYMSVFAE